MNADSPAATTPMCPQHPDTPAPYVCARCQTAACGECCYTMPDGSVCCKACFAAETQPEQPAAATGPLRVSSLRLASQQPASHAASRAAAPPPGQGCVQHPDVMSVARCHNCGARSCHTCDFVFPGNLHFCPVCVASATGKLSLKRRQYLIAAMILAAWSSLGFVAFLGGAVAGLAEGETGEMLLGVLLLLLVGFPSVVGAALGMSAKRRGGPNPVTVWIALIWNSLLLACLALLTIIGNLSG